MTESTTASTPSTAVDPETSGWTARLRRHPAVAAGAVVLAAVVAGTLLAPWLTPQDPLFMDPLGRLAPPSGEHLLGTDAVGRDVLSRTVHGGRTSLAVGLSVGVLATLIGLPVGLLSGYSRWADAVVTRLMDGLMAIPAILLAIALMAVMRAGLGAVIVAVTAVEAPRVVRLVRGVVLSVQLPYVEAAVVAGSRPVTIMVRHILPHTLAPLAVQATHTGTAAIVIESLLSFLGAGTPPEVPSWGNIMAEGRGHFLVAPWIVLAPGAVLAATVLAVTLLGDGVRDLLGQRAAERP